MRSIPITLESNNSDQKREIGQGFLKVELCTHSTVITILHNMCRKQMPYGSNVYGLTCNLNVSHHIF